MTSINTSPENPDHDAKPPPTRSSYSSIKDQFGQLSAQKQFAFISLVALGTSMLITGRSVRAVMKRAGHTKATESEVREAEKKMRKLKMREKEKASEEIKSTRKMLSINGISISKKKQEFWDNKSLMCVKDREEEKDQEDQEMKFNPALDGLAAFTIASILVLGASTWTIKALSHRWQLDDFNDWRIFIQSGYLAKRIIPKNLSKSIAQSIPNRLRTSDTSSTSTSSPATPTPTSNSNSVSDADADSNSKLLDFIQTFDHQWKIEKKRREIERINWENLRKSSGKIVWSE